ncbi:TetR family transcriptional regulator [Actinoplanes philippinensis]|uniref:Regulatory protein, tetR family n=1 Tax=Actinoplanes philippinensis TaxID=35752 RepID=A0A1I2NDT7_9ACTN|nr:TetR family transcriptional regulator [Actinoplanes philippinensis]GIE83465.1 TetR family transcriptional regulator [Actinoplanes philippinensis]SFF99676.1 regulatory protein, tetR family [Actinoplanes philippinensis]
MTFQRARSEEQREIRRRAILDTAAAMLDEMPVTEVSLNELSRRVGLAKSNVVRYFETREAVLLELLTRFLREWLAVLAGELAAGIDPRLPATDRAGLLTGILTRSLADRPVLCGLFGAQGGVLEQNVSVEVVTRHKRESLEILDAATTLIREHVPELGDGARAYCLQVLVLAGALSAALPPPAGVLAAYQADPSLAVLHTDLHDALHVAVTMTTLGALPRS